MATIWVVWYRREGTGTSMKRRECVLLVALPHLSVACEAAQTGPPMTAQQQKFKDFALTLVVDAVPGVEMLGNEFFADDALRPFYRSSVTRKGNRSILAYPGGYVLPEQVRVVWRKSDKWAPISWGSAHHYDDHGKPKPGYRAPADFKFVPADEVARRKAIAANTGVLHHGPWASDYGDEVVGDYTIAVASRIPDSVVQALRRDPKGDLRLKFRLKADGVLFGWDIERRPGWKPGRSVPPVYEEVGGDFSDTVY
jgi:hypothetical protein